MPNENKFNEYIEILVKIFNLTFDENVISKDKINELGNNENYQIKLFYLAIFTINQIAALIDKLSIELIIQKKFTIIDFVKDYDKLQKFLQKNKINYKQPFSCKRKYTKNGKPYIKEYINSIGKTIIKYWNQVNLFKSVYIEADIYVFLSQFDTDKFINRIKELKNIRNSTAHDYNFWEREPLKRSLYGSSNFNGIFEKLSDFFILSFFLVYCHFLLSN